MHHPPIESTVSQFLTFLLWCPRPRVDIVRKLSVLRVDRRIDPSLARILLRYTRLERIQGHPFSCHHRFPQLATVSRRVSVVFVRVLAPGRSGISSRFVVPVLDSPPCRADLIARTKILLAVILLLLAVKRSLVKLILSLLLYSPISMGGVLRGTGTITSRRYTGSVRRRQEATHSRVTPPSYNQPVLATHSTPRFRASRDQLSA